MCVCVNAEMHVSMGMRVCGYVGVPRLVCTCVCRGSWRPFPRQAGGGVERSSLCCWAEQVDGFPHASPSCQGLLWPPCSTTQSRAQHAFSTAWGSHLAALGWDLATEADQGVGRFISLVCTDSEDLCGH